MSTQKGQAAELLTEAVENPNPPSDPKNLSLDSLVLLINSERLNSLTNKSYNELKELKERQEEVSHLHNILKSINRDTNSSGELDWAKNEEMQELLKGASKHDIEVASSKTPYKFSKDERDRLVENIRMTIDDLNVKNDMQLQMITRLMNERHESYLTARMILKPLHDDKINKARNAGGRN